MCFVCCLKLPQRLLEGIRTAKRRICWASLYVGTEGGPEGELVDALKEAVRARPELEVRGVTNVSRSRSSPRARGAWRDERVTLFNCLLTGQLFVMWL